MKINITFCTCKWNVDFCCMLVMKMVMYLYNLSARNMPHHKKYIDKDSAPLTYTSFSCLISYQSQLTFQFGNYIFCHAIVFRWFGADQDVGDNNGGCKWKRPIWQVSLEAVACLLRKKWTWTDLHMLLMIHLTHSLDHYKRARWMCDGQEALLQPLSFGWRKQQYKEMWRYVLSNKC